MREDVAAILFDEPLTVIDPHLKWLLRRKLKEVHPGFRHTLVYVTHDQNEALTFADKVVVMYEGEVVQLGTPQELFERPAHRFVGYFIGSPGHELPALPMVDGGADRRRPMRAGRPLARGRTRAPRRASSSSASGRNSSAEPAGDDGLPGRDRAGGGSRQLQAGHGRLGGAHVKAKLDEDAQRRAATRPSAVRARRGRCSMPTAACVG